MITFLDIVIVILKIVEVLAVIAIFLIGMDLAFWYHKDLKAPKAEGKHKPETIAREKAKAEERHRKELEAISHRSFFEEPYVRGFDLTGELLFRDSQAVTEKGLEYSRRMDELADALIFENTKEL